VLAIRPPSAAVGAAGSNNDGADLRVVQDVEQPMPMQGFGHDGEVCGGRGGWRH
jgi:hypothetical protein